MKLHYPKSHYDKSFRGMVFPLLKPFIKGENFSDEQRISLYGVSDRDFHFTDILEEADLAILTMAWNYYEKVDQLEKAVHFVKKCKVLNIKVIVLNAGDFGVKIPVFNNLIVLRQGGYKSRFSANRYAIPPFIEDPIKKNFDSKEFLKRPYNPIPKIGFCGQANPSKINAAKEVLNIILRNLKFYCGQSKQEPQQLLSATYLRASVLKSLEKSKILNTNFILRKQYRAGVNKGKDTHKTTLEFYENIKSSDYVVCVRGAGNFSVRFYETLAMGRIPVFINTDCALPLENEIHWKNHVVWVDYEERNEIAQKVNDFHHSLSNKDFIDLQLSNRKLWEEYLVLGGFFKSFIKNNVFFKNESKRV